MVFSMGICPTLGICPYLLKGVIYMSGLVLVTPYVSICVMEPFFSLGGGLCMVEELQQVATVRS